MDTATSLDWLDVTETVNVAFNDAVGSANARFGTGWRLATGAEICVPFLAYGVDPVCGGVPPETQMFNGVAFGLAGANAPLVGSLGIVLSGGSSNSTVGFNDDQDASSVFAGNAAPNIPFMDSSSVLANVPFADPTIAQQFIGNFLVRLPEPAPAVLVLLGAARAAARRKTHCKRG